MGVTLTDVLLFGKAQSDDVDNATLVIYRRNILRWSALGGYLDVIVKGVSPLSLPDAVAGSLSYVKAFGGTEQRNLPNGYTQVDYVTNTTKTAVNTGIMIDLTKNYEFEVECRATTGSWFILQSRESISSPNTGITGSSTGDTIILVVDGTTVCTSGITRTLGNRLYVNATLNNGVGTLYVKDITAGTEDTVTRNYSASATNPTVPMYLLGSAAGQYVDTDSNVYMARIKENGVTIMDYVPAKQDTTAGFYDTVRGTFKTAGTPSGLSAGAVVSPSPDTPVDIVSNNGVLKVYKNLFDRNDPTTTINAYIGLSSVGSSADVVSSTNDRSFIIKTSPNTKYTIQKLGGESPYNRFRVSESSVFPQIGQQVTKLYDDTATTSGLRTTTITTGNSGNYIIVYGLNGSPGTELPTFLDNFVVCEGGTINVGQIYTDGTVETIKDSLNNTATAEMLLSVDTYTDQQEVISGSVARKCGAVILDSSLEWTYDSNYGRVNATIPNLWGSTVARTVPGFCTHFEWLSHQESISSITPGQCYSAGANRIFLHISQTSADAFSAWLDAQKDAGTPVIIVFPLENTTTESVTGQTLQVQAGDNTLEITQASLSGLELEAQYQAAVSLTIQEVQDANLDPNVEVTIN